MKFGATKPNAVRPTSSPVKDIGTGAGKPPLPKNEANQLQFMSDKLRGAPMTGPLGGVGKPPATPQTASLVKAYNAQKSGNMGVGSQAAKTGLGDTFKGVARPPTSLANLGSALQQLGAGRAMKKGGAVKSSASKRGDGIAQRGKTKGRIV